MNNPKYLILGAGPASAGAIRGIRGEDEEGSITLVGAEQYRTYSMPMLTKGFIQGRYAEEKLFSVKEDFYDSNNVSFISCTKAKSVNTGSRKVVLEDGKELGYEKLLICTGGSPVRFGHDRDVRRIYYLRTLDDAKMIKAASESAKHAVVVGGSFIGVEVASALRELGLSVDLIMMEDYVYERLIPESVGRYLGDLLADNGVRIISGEKVSGFSVKDGMAESVNTEGGSSYDGDMFVVGIGIRANIGFLEDDGIETSRGILVNEYLETSVEGVFAAGDVAEFQDAVLGIRHISGHIENAQQQGQTAGSNMAGALEKYERVTGYDTEIFGDMLMFVGAPENADSHLIREADGAPSASFSLKDGRITGGLLIKPGGKDIRAFKDLVSRKEVDFGSYENELCDPDTPLPGIVKKIYNNESRDE